LKKELSDISETEINEFYETISIKFKKLGNDGFSLAYSGLKSPIPNENNMG